MGQDVVGDPVFESRELEEYSMSYDRITEGCPEQDSQWYRRKIKENNPIWVRV